ncbi:MAG: hypothetical protein CO138_01970 [Candidatus Moranbacteria bacterium CG_4_9_14_3_um_filter_33_15]|nr:MAG: hypothetical protein CO138_01970 [Candidatus Moranbacteria bacterium CG_4_9_14_3_um_filter_33_15]
MVLFPFFYCVINFLIKSNKTPNALIFIFAVSRVMNLKKTFFQRFQFVQLHSIIKLKINKALDHQIN